MKRLYWCLLLTVLVPALLAGQADTRFGHGSPTGRDSLSAIMIKVDTLYSNEGDTIYVLASIIFEETVKINSETEEQFIVVSADGDTVELDPQKDLYVIRYSDGGTNKVWIDSTGKAYFAGNVGIGTTGPESVLHVSAADGGPGDNLWAAQIKNLESTDNRSFGLIIDAGSTSTDDNLRLRTHDGGTELMVVQGDGNVGIGTTGPGVILEVADNNANAARTLFTLLNDDEHATGETGQTVDIEFELKGTIDSGSNYTNEEAAKISAYKISDYWHAADQTDNDAGLKIWTVMDGSYVLNMTLSDDDVTVAGVVTANGANITGAKLTTDQEITINIGAYDFVTGATHIWGEVAAHPTDVNGTMYAPFSVVPYNHIGGTAVIDQITVYYITAADGDDFDFMLQATDQDGGVTTIEDHDNIGNGTTGHGNTTLLAADITMTDFSMSIEIDVNNTDANTDVKIHQIKVEYHLE